MTSAHLDETGQPCTRHAPLASDTLLSYAAVGSRVSGFHHDIASKLQSLMMALDEIGELASNPDVAQATETAQAALRELHQLIQVNRALAKAPQRKRTQLPDLVGRAAERFGVRLQGKVPEHAVMVASASIIHALALVLEVTAGPVQLGRNVEISVTTGEGHVLLAITGGAEALASPPPNANELVAISSFLLRREAGELRCSARGFSVRLPVDGADST